ncbi:lytic transglycosylase domain-containing protein [Piscinibacter sp.]|uniref:lytic transglycosylase domain-containing protein n=1 Tax=Piscinibacter sp. TaxID=1903157 RepID=UPI002CEBFDB3|nr:transglycosylase SLT domain-containing protein [Albitalea sp.]HUG25007.1 transglycosylase SLT domain-containing protein [Albitalea sp.]
MSLKTGSSVSVYGRLRARLAAGVAGTAWALCGLLAAPAACAQTGDETILEANDAFRKKDKDRLAAARAAAMAGRHPLATWVEYWDLTQRLADAAQPEIDAFYARWKDTYVEDRLRNDWLLELGRRRDWANFAVDFPRFRMNDDREVTCYALLTEHLAGKGVAAPARAAWFAQTFDDDGCALLARTLVDAKVFGSADIWRKARLAIDAKRAPVARQAAALIGESTVAPVQALVDNPARFLARHSARDSRAHAELAALALMRMAGNDPGVAAVALTDRWERALPRDLASWAWASVAKQSAMRLLPEAPDHYRRAAMLAGRSSGDVEWPESTLDWKVRAALRADNGRGQWQQVVQGINAMDAAAQRDPAWVYWKARGLQALADDSQDADGMRAQARELLASIAGPLDFYGALAAESLGRPLTLPPRPQPLTPEERRAAAEHPGLTRALQLIGLGLRSEGVREWNYSLRGLGERELLAAAQLACDREVWDRCINTSERTRHEIDIEQRFPMPFRTDLITRAREAGLDPAYVYGLIRQESRFITDARSHVGASGLMQVMPATARWTARKIGLDYTPGRINDRDTNLRIGTGYLKIVLDTFEGSQPMAAAAYNAGPNRPRRWREGPWLEPAAWAENIPFTETRDYVKKVLANASIYAALLNDEPPALVPRLGRMIGPRAADAPEPESAKDVP